MTNFKVSKRLQLLASLVDKNAHIVDVGCDHALLDIYLIKNNIVKKAIASDITKGAIDNAIKNVKENNLEKKIDIRLGDGLTTINKKDNIDTIILAGLGDAKIISILNNYDLDNINSIIVQSNTRVKDIRIAINKMGYYIDDEKMILEKNIYYTIIKFKKGIKKYSKKEYKLGPILLKNKEVLLKQYLERKIEKNTNIINNLSNKNLIVKIKLLNENRILKKEVNSLS